MPREILAGLFSSLKNKTIQTRVQIMTAQKQSEFASKETVYGKTRRYHRKLSQKTVQRT